MESRDMAHPYEIYATKWETSSRTTFFVNLVVYNTLFSNSLAAILAASEKLQRK